MIDPDYILAELRILIKVLEQGDSVSAKLLLKCLIEIIERELPHDY